MKASLEVMCGMLKEKNSLFEKAFQHGTMSVELYIPNKVDLQQPHLQDELYVVIKGSGDFINGDIQHPFVAGDVIFVKAGVTHRFLNFTEDFITWVIFYGKEGGER